jgi:hypothetical protein
MIGIPTGIARWYDGRCPGAVACPVAVGRWAEVWVSRRMAIALAAALAVVVLVALVLVGRSSLLPDSRAEVHARLAGVGDALARAGTAVVTFSGELVPQVPGPGGRWAGTSTVRFGDDPAADTGYARIEADGRPAVQARELSTGTDTYYRSPALAPADGRPWIDGARTAVRWPSPYADPGLRVTDLQVWQGFLRGVSEYDANEARTDDLPDVPDAPHEYRLLCVKSAASCPPPFGSPLDTYFNVVPTHPVLSAWIDDDGRLRKFQVEAHMLYQGDQPGGNTPGVTHPSGEYIARATFALDRFGTPLTVTAPPADQVTQERSVSVPD